MLCGPVCGPLAGADVGACCMDAETTRREAVTGGDGPLWCTSTLPCMAFARGTSIRGCDGPDPAALTPYSMLSAPPPLWTTPSMHTVPPLWTDLLVQLASPEHADLIIDQQTDWTQTETLTNQLQDTGLHVEVMAAQLERRYPTAKAATPEQAKAPTSPIRHGRHRRKDTD